MATKTKQKQVKGRKSKAAAKIKTDNRKSGEVMCEMLLKGATLDEIWEVMQVGFANTTAGKERTSCRQQISWYRSQLRTGKMLYDMNKGVLINLKSKKHSEHPRAAKDNLTMAK